MKTSLGHCDGQKYCDYHQEISLPTNDLRALRNLIQKLITDGHFK